MGAGYLLLNTLFAGGVIGVINSADGLFTMRKFWGEAGAHFWRFFRLMLISLFLRRGLWHLRAAAMAD